MQRFKQETTLKGYLTTYPCSIGSYTFSRNRVVLFASLSVNGTVPKGASVLVSFDSASSPEFGLPKVAPYVAKIWQGGVIVDPSINLVH